MVPNLPETRETSPKGCVLYGMKNLGQWFAPINTSDLEFKFNAIII